MTTTLERPQEVDRAGYLKKLLELGRTLNASLNLSEVLHVAIEMVVEFVHAERGFILLVEEGSNRVWGKATRNIEPEALERLLSGKDPNNQPEVSRTIVQQTLADREAVVSTNAMEDPRFSSHTSVKLANVRSVLCVPLISQGRTLGIVYLDNRVVSGLFDESHVEMLTAFSHQASVAIENARLYENLRKSVEERLRLQQEINEKETQRLALQHANELKSEFIGYVTHELRNPLTTIRGFVQTLSTDTNLPDETRHEFYGTIEAEADRMLALINQLLDSSRLEANRPITLSAAQLNPRPLIERVARAQRFYKYWTPEHQLRLDIADDLPEIVADEDKLYQILINLLTNAIKYSPNGGDISVIARELRGGIEISVQDEGFGMTDDQCARVFDPYERLDREETRKIQGTGLGLFLTRRLVELHGGTIHCESSPGRGSTFTFWLPASPSSPSE